MLANFNKAFKENISKTKIPDAVLEALSENLPDDFQYVQIDRETLAITTKTKPLDIKLNLKVPSDIRIKSHSELMEYLYRTQQRIESSTNFITINDFQFEIDQVINRPFSDSEFSKTNTKIILQPSPFPQPFPVSFTLEEEGIVKEFFLQRLPFASMEKCKFENVGETPIKISYILDERIGELKLNIKLNILKSKSVEEVIESYKLYKGFFDGKVRVWDELLEPFKSEQIMNFEEIIDFWEKVKVIENKFMVNFNLDEEISPEEVITFEKLFRSFINMKPYRESVSINSFTANDLIENKEIINQDIMFQFRREEEFMVLGVNITVSSLVVIFDFKISEIVNKKNGEETQYEIFVEPTNKEGVTMASLHFFNAEQANQYRKSFEDVGEEFMKATPID